MALLPVKLTHHIANHRFGFGGPLDSAVNSIDAQQGLISQLTPLHYAKRSPTSNELIAELKQFKKTKIAQKNKLNDLSIDVKAMDDKIMEDTARDNKNDMSEVGDDSVKSVRRAIIRQSSALQADTLKHAITTEQGFQARLLDFFSNHFSVSATNINIRVLAPTLEREAIAPRLSGQFSELLIAVEQHPAMQIYLNNNQSIGPDSKRGQAKNKGLNENLSREILELHTLGVNGGYSQNDVRELAMAITGWTVNFNTKGTNARGKKPEPLGFIFRQQAHQPGPRRLLGKPYSQPGIVQGERMLYDLSVHPATAKHMSFKLARHFISDNPDEQLVKAMTQTWLKTEGNLTAVLTTLIEHPASWKPETKKYKTPREFLISTYRACGAQKSKGNTGKRRLQSLSIMGQTPFAAGSPAGYGDTEDDWNGAEALISRIEWIEKFTQGIDINVLELADAQLGEMLDLKTRKIIERAESRQQALALLLLSPAFMYR